MLIHLRHCHSGACPLSLRARLAGRAATSHSVLQDGLNVPAAAAVEEGELVAATAAMEEGVAAATVVDDVPAAAAMEDVPAAAAVDEVELVEAAAPCCNHC